MNENNLFYTCSLIEYIARYTNNTKKVIIEKLKKDKVEKIYNLADIYHCENIEKIANEIIDEYNISKGTYIYKLNDNKPTYFDIGKVYQRLIIMVNINEKNIIDDLIKVLSSWIIEKIDDYSSSMYYENPSYIYECYKSKKIL